MDIFKAFIDRKAVKRGESGGAKQQRAGVGIEPAEGRRGASAAVATSKVLKLNLSSERLSDSVE